MSQPTAAVVIPLSSSDTGEGTVSPDNLSFSATNWNAEQLVTVTGVDDNLSDGNQGYRIILGADNSTSDTTGYNGLDPQDVAMSTTDDESASFMVSAASGSTSEVGGTAVFGVRLMSQPTAAVVIPLSSSDTGEGTVSPDNLSFSATNWNAEQLVTVTGVDDNLSDGNQGCLLYTSPSPRDS